MLQSRVPTGFRVNQRRTRWGIAAPLLLSLVGAPGCSQPTEHPEPEGTEEPSDPWAELPQIEPLAPELASFRTRTEQFNHVCSLEREDDFLRHLCASPRPVLEGLKDLLALLGLDEGGVFALTANSTSLVMRAVSAVNPRAIIFPPATDGTAPDELNIVSFVRGEPFVEIAARNERGDYNFYLLTFERECNYTGGCDLASLFTEEIESGWTAYSVYSERELRDTPLDCLSCHQPGGNDTPTILRMQELRSPWLHWFPQKFAQRTESDLVLLPQFLEAHSVDQNYAGIPINTIETAVSEGSGAHLEELIRAEGQADQPDVFDPLISRELRDNGSSERWNALYSAFLAGDAISVPFPGLDPTDPELRSAAVQSYVNVVTGASDRSTLVNLYDLFTDDARYRLGIVPPPDADGQTVLHVACARCHNGRAGPELRRSRFNVRALGEMSREMKDLAIDRMQQPHGAPTVMPPERFGPLPPDAISRAIEALQN